MGRRPMYKGSYSQTIQSRDDRPSLRETESRYPWGLDSLLHSHPYTRLHKLPRLSSDSNRSTSYIGFIQLI